jgi:hypothetical protein
MSDSPSSSDQSSSTAQETTLYDPPSEDGEAFSDDVERRELRLEIPQDLANRLLEVSLHLGLSPSTVASRAIGLVCDEIGLVDREDLSSDTLIQKYQTRLDLLHTLDYDLQRSTTDAEDDTERFDWDAVDAIIEQGESTIRSSGSTSPGTEEGSAGPGDAASEGDEADTND